MKRFIGVMVAGAVLAIPSMALAKKTEAAPALRAGVNVPCLEKIVKGDAPTPEAWITLGYLDQVRGDLKGALEKYKKAFAAGAKDLANAPIDFTLVSEAVWIQDAKCPVPVPATGADASATADKVKTIDTPKYPEALTGLASEGNATVSAVIGPDGHPIRIHVSETTAGPLQIERKREPGEEDGERLLCRVQFALISMLALKTHSFPDGNSGKIYSQKFQYVPPKDLLTSTDSSMPGKTDVSRQTPATSSSSTRAPR